jgi:hypothetical protein
MLANLWPYLEPERLLAALDLPIEVDDKMCLADLSLKFDVARGARLAVASTTGRDG